MSWLSAAGLDCEVGCVEASWMRSVCTSIDCNTLEHEACYGCSERRLSFLYIVFSYVTSKNSRPFEAATAAPAANHHGEEGLEE